MFFSKCLKSEERRGEKANRRTVVVWRESSVFGRRPSRCNESQARCDARIEASGSEQAIFFSRTLP
jgi:hypothetical protein